MREVKWPNKCVHSALAWGMRILPCISSALCQWCPVSHRFQGNIIVRYENDILVSMSVFCYLHTLKNSNYNSKSLNIGICSEIFYLMRSRPKNQKDWRKCYLYGSWQVYTLHSTNLKRTLKAISLVDGCMVHEQRWGDEKMCFLLLGFQRIMTVLFSSGLRRHIRWCSFS